MGQSVKARFVIAAAVVSLASVAVLVLVVLEFGLRRPSPPSLTKNPDVSIPGEILYRSDVACLIRAPASGASPREEICLPIMDRYGPMSWVEERTVVLAGGPEVAAFDLDTGRQVAVPPGIVTPDPMKPVIDGSVAPSGDMAIIDEQGRVYVISGTTKTQIADFDVERWELWVVLWSPDSNWLLLRYQPPRGDDSELWIVSRDGKTKGTLARDQWRGEWASWRIEGVGVTPDFTRR